MRALLLGVVWLTTACSALRDGPLPGRDDTQYVIFRNVGQTSACQMFPEGGKLVVECRCP